MIDLLLLSHTEADGEFDADGNLDSDGAEIDVVLEDGPTLAVSLTVWSAGKSWQTRTLHIGDLCMYSGLDVLRL